MQQIGNIRHFIPKELGKSDIINENYSLYECFMKKKSKRHSGIIVINRQDKRAFEEEVAGLDGLVFLYTNQGIIAKIAQFLFTHSRFPSMVYGWIMHMSWSRHLIDAFVKKHHIDLDEFQKPGGGWTSFASFFERKLKNPQKRIPAFLQKDPTVAIIPADGRYLVYAHLDSSKTDFLVKGKRFHLQEFLKDEALAKEYEGGSMVVARLAPADYHRFHFSFDCTVQKTTLINGALRSVNPIATFRDPSIFWENKRYHTLLANTPFGEVLCVDVGATCVGKVFQEKSVGAQAAKGEERGRFALGGSTIVLLFKKGQVEFNQDLLDNSRIGKETLCRFGQSMCQKS